MKFLTLFPRGENVHLVKDVGMIPFVLQENFQYDSYLSCYSNGDYPYLNKEVKGLKLLFINKKFNIEIVDVILFIIKNFRKFDVLQCYHLSKSSLIYLSTFNFLKKCTFQKCCTYLKLDDTKDIINIRLNPFAIFLIKSISIVSIESVKLCKILNKNNILKREVIHVLNGILLNTLESSNEIITKSNLIITVGRIGSHQKNNEVLLESFIHFSKLYPNWRLELIGPIEDKFQTYIKEYFENNSNLIEKVNFSGNITDRKKLLNKYKQAKIFVLTSRYEGFPLVLLEALKFGCNIISSDIEAAYDITNNEKHGYIYKSNEWKSLFNKLEELAKNEDLIEINSNKSIKYVNDFFS